MSQSFGGGRPWICICFTAYCVSNTCRDAVFSIRLLMPNGFYYTYPGRLKIVARVGTHCTLPPNQVCVSPGRLSSYERNFSSKIVSFIRGFTFTLTSATFDSCAYSARLPWRIPLSLFLSKLLHASISAFFMTSHESLEQVVCQTCSTELDDCSRISLAPFPIP